MRWVATVDMVLLPPLCVGQAKQVEALGEKRRNQVTDGDVGHDIVKTYALGRLDRHGQEGAVEGAERGNAVPPT